MNHQTIGDGPVQPEIFQHLQAVAMTINDFINGENTPPESYKWAFVVMMAPFGSALGRCNYISNAQRMDVIRMLRDQLAHFEKQLKPREQLESEMLSLIERAEALQAQLDQLESAPGATGQDDVVGTTGDQP